MRSFDIARRPKKKAREAGKPIAFPAKPSPAISQALAFATESKRKWLKFWIFLFGVLVLGGFLWAFFVLPNARIEIVASSEAQTRDFDVLVDSKLPEANLAELSVPGRLVTKEVFGFGKFGATGVRKIGKVASGFVHIYNFSKSTLILRAQTTILSVAEKKYFFAQDVSGIRPTALIGLEEQEVDPTSLIAPVPVVAAEPGSGYNLPNGARIEVQNEAFGSNPKTLYAVVAEEISGGSDEESKVVTEADIAKAYEVLYQDLLEKAKQELVSENPGVLILENALRADILEPKTSALAGAEVSEFEAASKVRLRALVFEEAEVQKLVTARIKRLLPENKILLEDKPSDYVFQAQFANVSVEQGLGVLVVHYEGRVVYEIDQETILQRIKGKTVEEMREILLSRPEIESVTIKLYPFWVKRAPKIAKKITIEVLTEIKK